MLPLAQAQQQLYSFASKLATQRVRLADALARVTSEPIYATSDYPVAAVSAMDGYALAAPATSAKPWRLAVSQVIYAGQPAKPLKAGSCARVFTGSVLPAGADRVVIQERVSLDGDCIRLDAIPAAGSHLRMRASVYTKGQLLMNRGRLIKPQHISLLASDGITDLAVGKKPRVSLLSTGDELLQVDNLVRMFAVANPAKTSNLAPKDWQLFDSNQPQIASLLTWLGCEVTRQIQLDDNPQKIEQCLSEQASKCDLLICCGGASVGDKDFLHRSVTKLGKIHHWKVAIRPGKPFLFGEIKAISSNSIANDKDVVSTPILCLPGNPLSAFITSLMLVRPFVGGMLGIDTDYLMPEPFDQLCDFEYEADSTRLMWLQVCRKNNRLQLAGRQLSDQLVSAAEASGIAMLKAGESVGVGDSLPYLPYNSLLHW